MYDCHQKKQRPELGDRFILSSDCSNADHWLPGLLLNFKAGFFLFGEVGVSRLFPSPAASVWLRDTRGMEDFWGCSQFSTQSPVRRSPSMWPPAVWLIPVSAATQTVSEQLNRRLGNSAGWGTQKYTCGVKKGQHGGDRKRLWWCEARMGKKY